MERRPVNRVVTHDKCDEVSKSGFMAKHFDGGGRRWLFPQVTPFKMGSSNQMAKIRVSLRHLIYFIPLLLVFALNVRERENPAGKTL